MKTGPKNKVQRTDKKKRRSQSDLEQNQSNDLVIDPSEWDEANTFFSAKRRRSCKLDKETMPDILSHSFLELDGDHEVIALARREEGKLGEGAFGIVVKGQMQTGEDCAVKIEGGKRRDPKKDESIKLMKLLGYHLGEVDRKLPQPKEFKKTKINSKRYTVFKLLPGIELKKQLENLTDEQKIIVAIKCCEAVNYLHSKRIVHADIKPENFIAEILENDITVNCCDYDFLKILPNNQDYITSEYWVGTQEYMPPEIGPKCEVSRYSFASDIYSLGVMFQKDLKLPEDIYKPMIARRPNQRCDLASTLNKLKQLETTVVQDNSAQNANRKKVLGKRLR